MIAAGQWKVCRLQHNLKNDVNRDCREKGHLWNRCPRGHHGACWDFGGKGHGHVEYVSWTFPLQNQVKGEDSQEGRQGIGKGTAAVPQFIIADIAEPVLIGLDFMKKHRTTFVCLIGDSVCQPNLMAKEPPK